MAIRQRRRARNRRAALADDEAVPSRDRAADDNAVFGQERVSLVYVEPVPFRERAADDEAVVGRESNTLA